MFFIINAEYICHSITYYKIYIKSYLIIINSINSYYKLFICPLLLTIILICNLIVITTLNNKAINLTYFNHNKKKYTAFIFYILI